ncbi:MAG: PRC-barrel domain-containing protein [Ginsengibacter sp.]
MSKEPVVINETLQELGSSGYEMAKGEPDIRGWKVINAANQQIGKVKELLFDVQAQKIRYVITDVDGKPLNLLSRNVIVPVGLAELDEKEKVMYVPDLTIGHLATLPEYKKGKVTYETERAIRDVFIPQKSSAAEKLADFESREQPEREAFYDNDYFNQDRLYRRRNNDYKPGESIIKREAQKADTNFVMENEVRNTTADNIVKEDVVYIPDENDPTILRKAKIVRETPRDED